MKQHFNNENGKFAFARKFFSIPEQAISHYNSKDACKTLKKMTKCHCFQIDNPNTVYYRTLTCHCNICSNGKWNDCKCSKICGDWISYDWKHVNNVDSNATMARRRKRSDSDGNEAKRRKYSHQFQPFNTNNCNSLQLNFFVDFSMNVDDVQV